jgi:hypothetical protein
MSSPITTHARAGNRSFDELKKLSTIVRPTGQEIYSTPTPREYLISIQKAQRLTIARLAPDPGSGFNQQANGSMTCTKCSGRGFTQN